MFSIASSSGHVEPGDGALERIEVDADQIDRLDLVLSQRLGVLRVVAYGQQRRVQVRVERLHPAVEDLREPGQLLDRPRVDPGLAEHRQRPAGRDDLDTLLRQPGGELGHAGLVGDRDQRPSNRQRLAGRFRAISGEGVDTETRV